MVILEFYIGTMMITRNNPNNPNFGGWYSSNAYRQDSGTNHGKNMKKTHLEPHMKGVWCSSFCAFGTPGRTGKMDTSDATDLLQHVSGARAALLFTCSWVWKSHIEHFCKTMQVIFWRTRNLKRKTELEYMKQRPFLKPTDSEELKRMLKMTLFTLW